MVTLQNPFKHPRIAREIDVFRFLTNQRESSSQFHHLVTTTPSKRLQCVAEAEVKRMIVLGLDFGPSAHKTCKPISRFKVACRERVQQFFVGQHGNIRIARSARRSAALKNPKLNSSGL